MEALPRLLARFESLGDTCGFGFLQRRHDSDTSALFRWKALGLNGPVHDFGDFFLLGNLIAGATWCATGSTTSFYIAAAGR